MSATIEFYTNPMSRGRTVHWMLEELEVPYEVHLLDFGKAEHKAPHFLRINPMGKVPTIVHRGTVVTECAAIVAYLADAFPQAGLAPAFDDLKRGTYLRWLFFAAGCLEPAVIDKMLARPIAEKKSALAYGSFEDAVGALDAALLPGPFILGERFSAADIYFTAQLGFGQMVKALTLSPTQTAYIERCTARPAYRRFEAKSAELSAQLKAAQ